MISYIRTNSENKDFQKLAAELDAALRILDGDEHLFYAQLNKTDMLKQAIAAYEDKIPVGCGAIRKYSEDTVEVKRMYVLPGYRGKGIASKILAELETWAEELKYKKCILETGSRQIEAISLYTKSGYKMTGNFGHYQNVKNSVCFEKPLQPQFGDAS